MDMNMIADCVQGAVPPMLVARFNDTLFEFLSNLRDTFPDYELVLTRASNELQLALRMGQKDLAMHMFVAAIHTDGYDKLVHKNEEFLFKLCGVIDFMKELNMKSLWSECPVEVRDNVWLYLIELASLAQSYSKATTTTNRSDMLRTMETLDRKIEGMLQSGMPPNDVLNALLTKK